MNDLISRQALLDAMDKRYNEKRDIVPNNFAEGFMQMDKLIKEQPIAYDIEKVVAKLKEWTFNADVNIGDETIMNHNLIVSKNAIDIVREGGAE